MITGEIRNQVDQVWAGHSRFLEDAVFMITSVSCTGRINSNLLVRRAFNRSRPRASYFQAVSFHLYRT